MTWWQACLIGVATGIPCGIIGGYVGAGLGLLHVEYQEMKRELEGR